MAKDTKYSFSFFSVNGTRQHKEVMTEQQAYNYAMHHGFIGRYSIAKPSEIHTATFKTKRKPRSKHAAKKPQTANGLNT